METCRSVRILTHMLCGLWVGSLPGDLGGLCTLPVVDHHDGACAHAEPAARDHVWQDARGADGRAGEGCQV